MIAVDWLTQNPTFAGLFVQAWISLPKRSLVVLTNNLLNPRYFILQVEQVCCLARKWISLTVPVCLLDIRHAMNCVDAVSHCYLVHITVTHSNFMSVVWDFFFLTSQQRILSQSTGTFHYLKTSTWVRRNICTVHVSQSVSFLDAVQE